MNVPFGSDKTLGILGGGQLGKMLAQAASPWDLALRILDPTPGAPAAHLCQEFVQGDFRDYETVLAFGRGCDLLTIEIEQVNADALAQLASEGIPVYPQPAALRIIQDKGLQKEFYTKHGLPTAAFQLFDGPEALRASQPKFPFVQKTRTEGYDGRGVKILRDPKDLDHLLPGKCLLEDAVKIQAEIAVIAARSANGEITNYDPVEMSFHPEANLVEFLVCPARISPSLAKEAGLIARAVIEAFELVGLLAVELFLTTEDEWLINEVAPRPHNSGHHTIEACLTSQYQQHLRAIQGLPLGSTRIRQPAVMLNLLGEAGASGPVVYEGVPEIFAAPGAFLHLYGKHETRPFRKMGHVTVIDDDIDGAIATARRIRDTFKVTA